MNEQISFIVDIQNIDLELLKLEDMLKEKFKEIEGAEHLLDTKRIDMEKLNEELMEISKKADAAELDIKSCEGKMIKMKDTQKLIKTNKEYNAIQKSIKDNEILKKQLDDESLACMEDKESLVGKITAMQKEIAEIENDLSDKNIEYKGKEEECYAIKKGFVDKRESVKSKIKKNYLNIYETVRKNKGFPAIASVMESGACTGCYRMLPPQQFNELISGNVFMQCPICSRILYIEASLPAEAAGLK
ncbi:MAG TPA: hypothetical protein ENI54_02635 [bacterium]|nr:hypothetical protein [bacterium]